MHADQLCLTAFVYKFKTTVTRAILFRWTCTLQVGYAYASGQTSGNGDTLIGPCCISDLLRLAQWGLMPINHAMMLCVTSH